MIITDDMIDQAAKAIADLWKTSGHSQACPTFLEGSDTSKCNCFVLKNAKIYARTALLAVWSV